MLAAILLLGAVLRVGWPTLTEFKFDEARLEALALELTREGRLPLAGLPSSAGFDHSPISVYLYAPAFLLTSNPLPATIYSGLAGLAAVALCWWLARRWAGARIWGPLVATLLFAVSPWMIAFSRKIWQISFVPLLTLAFIGLVVSALIQGRRWHLAWALVVYALLVQVHPSAVSLALALVLWLVVFWRRVWVISLLAGAALALVTTVPFVINQIQQRWPVLAAFRAMPKATVDLTAIRLGWEAITGRDIHALAGAAYPLLEVVPQIDPIFHLVGWLTVLGTLWLAYRVAADWRAADAERQKAAQIDLVLVSWLVVPILFNLRHGLPLHLHSFALVAPSAYLIIGRAADSLLSNAPLMASCRTRSASAARALGIGSLIAMGLVAVAQVIALVLMARFVASHETPGGFGKPLGQYLAAADQSVALAGQLGAKEILVIAQGDSPVVDPTPAIFDVLLRDRVDYRFVDGETAAVFPLHQALALVTPQAGEATAWYAPWPTTDLGGGFQIIALDSSWPEEGLEPVAGPRTFQNGVEVQSHAWQGDTGRKNTGLVWLLWQVLWLTPDDSHFYVQLVDREGQFLAQKDTAGYPTAYRRRGDRIISKFDITYPDTVAPPPFWTRAGLYLYPEIINIPVIDGAGNPVAETVTLGPTDTERETLP